MGVPFVVCSLGPWRGASVENDRKINDIFCFLFFVCSDVCSVTNVFFVVKNCQKSVDFVCFCIDKGVKL